MLSLPPSVCRGGELPRSEPARRCRCPAVLGAARPGGAGVAAGVREGARQGGGVCDGRASWGVEKSGGIKGVCLAFPRWKGRPDPAAVAASPCARPERLAGGVRFGGVFFAEGCLGWSGALRPRGAAGSRHLPLLSRAGGLEAWCWAGRGPRSGETGELSLSGGIRRRTAPGARGRQFSPVCPPDCRYAAAKILWKVYSAVPAVGPSALPHSRGRGRQNAANLELKMSELLRGWLVTAVPARRWAAADRCSPFLPPLETGAALAVAVLHSSLP